MPPYHRILRIIPPRRTPALLRRMSLHTTTPPVLLCVDFDETITQRDTTYVLFQLAASSASTEQQLVTQYVDELGDLLQLYETKWQQQCNINKSFDSAGLHEFLEGYAAVDLRSLQRVVDCRALKGIQHQDITKAASNVQIRPNAVETLALADELKIISANWSQELVSSVLLQAGVAHGTMEIITNELKVDEQGVTTGEIDMKVQSCMDKAKWLDNVRSETQSTIVYVGDSAMDLLAMLAADVGIWVTSDTAASSTKLLKQLVENYKIEVHPSMNYSSLSDCFVKASDAGKPVLFTMTDWTQLKAIIGERLRN